MSFPSSKPNMAAQDTEWISLYPPNLAYHSIPHYYIPVTLAFPIFIRNSQISLKNKIQGKKVKEEESRNSNNHNVWTLLGF